MTESEAERLIFDHSLSRDRVGRIGVELEWFVLPVGDPGLRPGRQELARLADTPGQPLPAGGVLSWEPGAQLELSSLPRDSLPECVDAVTADLLALRSRCAQAGVRLLGAGLDHRPARFIVPLPRYLALRNFYARIGADGDELLCNTASLQVNVDAGDDSAGWRGRSRRWLIANALGPLLMAMFANSPVRDVQGPSGHFAVSGRQLLRFRADRLRTRALRPAGDPRHVWTQFALDSQVLAIRRSEGPFDVPVRESSGASGPGDQWEPAPEGLSLRRWLRGGGPRAVGVDDLFHHLKFLVPPVRACGHLELRMIDAQEEDDWMVPVAVVAALFDDEATSDVVHHLLRGVGTQPTSREWTDAARYGLAAPGLAELARTVMTEAVAGAHRLGASHEVTEAVERFADTFTLRGLSPAHQHLPGHVAVP
ncbi:glutamate-cysteine ligase family protein [Streptomyces sp. NPDC060198]|uniref:glutamate-cysteine ligase family protein n=1 Tax=Streptomyces sp. NPDC060198 TaxID=3347070 RepID=UPI003665E9C4